MDAAQLGAAAILSGVDTSASGKAGLGVYDSGVASGDDIKDSVTLNPIPVGAVAGATGDLLTSLTGQFPVIAGTNCPGKVGAIECARTDDP